MSVHVQDRRLKQIREFLVELRVGAQIGQSRIEDLPRERQLLEQLARAVLSKMTGVVVLAVPAGRLARPITLLVPGQLADEDRRPTFRQEEKCKARRDDREVVDCGLDLPFATLLWARPGPPDAGQSRTLAIPVVVADNSPTIGRHIDAVHVVWCAAGS